MSSGNLIVLREAAGQTAPDTVCVKLQWSANLFYYLTCLADDVSSCDNKVVIALI